ncbi:cellulose synthase-like protein D4 [Olea europaea var. sylvestris]|uniref:cellulose synthase-like protein D4 n=1 Tax=Olea europaea var. sylvestris TaxID=158386 RepID=UPI000C1CDC60|nr:cellulose synthase-like protein D4 [Olea europaea var. sylvestris]
MSNLSSQPSKKAMRAPGSGGSSGSSHGNRGPSGQTVKFARRTSSGRYVSLSREDLDMSGEISGDYMNYTVHIPPTPDNQPMDTSVATKAEEQYVSNSLFTGGFNSVTRAHLMDKVIESEVSHPQMAGSKGSSCAMPACDGKIMKDERGKDVIPCECRFKICRDCYMDAQKDTGLCPGCKEPYRVGDFDDDVPDFSGGALSLPAPEDSKGDRRMSMMKRNQNGEFDHNKWLFETQGTYGYGNAYWPQDDMYGDDADGVHKGMPDSSDKPCRPLSRIVPIPNSIISPYRLLIVVRLVVLAFFLTWRLKHPNDEAIWLWLMSVVCELWFAFSWVLDQVPKINPVSRVTDLEILRDKFDMPSSSNPSGASDLPGIDFFVSTADPEKEPPLVTANTILSILAVDYPVEKLACYVSDDGAALLTFEAMAEAASFADLWVPFCRKHDIEPRNPETYFTLKGDPTKNKKRPDFVKDRRRVKREYDEFKVRINGLPDSIRRRSDAFNAREEMKILKHMRESGDDHMESIKVQKATWMADGTHWPGTWGVSTREHAKGDHAGILQEFRDCEGGRAYCGDLLRNSWGHNGRENMWKRPDSPPDTSVHWGASDYPSKLREADLGRLRTEYRIPNSVDLILPGPEERACYLRPGCVAISEAILRAGLRLPIHPFFRGVVRSGDAPFRFPNSLHTQGMEELLVLGSGAMGHNGGGPPGASYSPGEVFNT